MDWVADILKIVGAVIGTTKDWGKNKAEVPWKEIYDQRRRVDKALEEKHRRDGDG